MADVLFQQATRMFKGASAPAVKGLDLHLEDGELLVLVGPSGSGKSTALRMLAGLEEVDAGALYIGGRDVTDIPPKHRDIAMVFQNYALYPYLTVRANIAFPLKMAGMRRAERERRVDEAADMLGLTHLLERRPAELSGGERQRTAMGRAIVRDPQVFLMDEPLSNLDAKLRVKMRVDIAALQRRLGTTMLYVTHDQVEAMTMGQRVAVLRDGELQQCGAPRELYAQPANVFVAGFIGSPAMNLCRTPLTAEGCAQLDGVAVPLPRETVQRAGERGLREVVLGLRPESLEIGDDAGVQAEVEVVEELGADAYAFCRAGIGGEEIKLIARADARRPPAPGERVLLRPRHAEAHVFCPDTGERLGG